MIQHAGDDPGRFAPRPTLLQDGFEEARQEKRLMEITVVQMEQQIRMVLAVRGQTFFEDQPNDLPGLGRIAETRGCLLRLGEFLQHPRLDFVGLPILAKLNAELIELPAKVGVRFSAGKIQIPQDAQGVDAACLWGCPPLRFLG